MLYRVLREVAACCIFSKRLSNQLLRFYFQSRNMHQHTSGLGNLKFLENFDNPYVRVSVFCKVCGKEQSLKYQFTWKRHFLTHSSPDEKPFNCSHCDKSFVQSGNLKKHVERMHTKLLKQEDDVKHYSPIKIE